MAAEALTPIDEIGMPLPLAPTNLEIHDASQPQPDWHHHFHPRKSSVLTQDWGGQAVRTVRVQMADYSTHHDDYHGHFIGPPLPETPAEKFGLTVLATAGYVPGHAIDFKKGEPQIVPLSDGQRKRLWSSGELRNSAPEIARKFILEYTLKQDFIGIDEKLVDEFLGTSDLDRKYKIGGKLLSLAVDTAVEPLDPFYRTAWKKGYIDRTSAHRPQRFLKTKIRLKTHQAALVDMLYDRLQAA
jgi:hypothetical protein